MRRNIKLMCWINLFSELKLYGAIIILYYIQVSGSMALGMSVFSIATIVSSLCELPTGIISDKVGRKRTVILGALSGLLSVFILAISRNYLMLVFSAFFNGLEIAFFSGNNQAIIYESLKELSSEKEFGKYVGKFNSMIYLAGAIAAVIGGLIVFITSFRFIIVLSVIPKLIQLLLCFKLKENESYKNKEKVLNQVANSLKAVYKSELLKKQIIADGISDGVGEACFQFRTAFYELVWPSWALGIPNLLSNIGAFFSNWFAGKMIKKFGKNKLYIFSNIYSMISNSIGVLLKNYFSPIIMVSNSIFSTEVIQMEVEHNLYDNKYRASMASIKALFKNLIFSLMAIALGFLADCVGVIIAFSIFQLFKVISIVIYTNIFKKLNSDKINIG